MITNVEFYKKFDIVSFENSLILYVDLVFFISTTAVYDKRPVRAFV